MKKVISIFLVFALLFVNAFAASSVYSNYNAISGKMELETEDSIAVGSKFKVNVQVDFEGIDAVTAFHIIGNVSDNIKISGFDFYNKDAKWSNTISSKMKDQTIDYMAASMKTETSITATDGFGKLMWIEFEALENGVATITLDDGYVKTAFETDDMYKRCLKISPLNVTVGDVEQGGDNTGDDNTGENTGGGSDDNTNTGGDNNEDNTGDDSTGDNTGSTGTGSSGSNSSGSSRPSSSGGSSGGKGGSTTVVVPTTPSVPEVKEVVFADVENSHWGYEFVKDLFTKEIVSGAGNDENGNPIINPNNSITRQEAAKLASSSANIATPTDHIHTFEDKDSIADWAMPFVIRCCEAGIIKGYEDNTFKPNNFITREELVTIIVKAFGIELSEEELTFADAGEITWSKPYIAAAIKAGITKGYEDGTFKPKANITRIEAITMFSRAMATLEK
ncbi:MAG: S-layer homology domain-containing protein [Ruminococcaceae bacterium]|nr:S-layer homology domain-containing protein [Oscillospiraceae bacterium]